ncbi:MAG: shikimate kinase [Flavobacteriia bacterium]|nr:shikimate kinase [Flavobacteriia bacterium]
MPNIILIGYMGCGKSTLGKKLAKKLSYDFIDSDMEIEKITNQTVNEIFNSKGEIFFRELESAFLLSLKKKNNYILSAGGGLPCFFDNIEKLKKLGTVLYLKLSPFELSSRLNHSKKIRPLLGDKNEEEIYYFTKEKLNERKEFYEKAHYILKGKQHNVQCIMELLGIEISNV